ncbi:hypothetical protein NL108_012240 [Boleophthalmus pectinirostris]|nr:hypothetical protein NL108_012240 [Boleophthalmus pectinirostris]
MDFMTNVTCFTEYHAEIDAIMKVADVHGCTMFVTMFPCNECAKVMIQSGIRHVVYLSENETAENSVKASGKMLRKENVCCEKYMGGKDPITLTFPNEESTEQTVRNRTPESDFMAVAVLTAQKSRDPSTQVGACIVRDDKVIVAVGHNQMPNNHNDRYTWVKEADDTKYLYVCHAELNAILSSTDVRGCTIYVTLFPCNDCAKLVIEAGWCTQVY